MDEPQQQRHERMLRTALLRTVRPLSNGFYERLEQDLAAIPPPSRFILWTLRYGVLAGVTILVIAVGVMIALGDGGHIVATTSAPSGIVATVLRQITTLSTAMSAVSVVILGLLFYALVGMELSRR